MKPLPTDPFAFQARAMSAMIEDIFDIGARRSTKFERLNALRQVSISTKVDPYGELEDDNGK